MTIVEQRAAARIAWRYARKAKARTALILFLIALPIAALVGTGILIKTVIKNPEDNVTRDMGSADLFLVNPPNNSTPASLGKVLPPGSVINGIEGTTAYKVSGGTLYTLTVTENSVPSDRAPTAAEYQMTSGRMPHAPDEAVLSPSLSRKLGVRIGDTLRLDGLKRPVTLVGLAWYRFNLSDNGVLVGPGTLTAEEAAGLPAFLVALPRGANLTVTETALQRAQVGFQDRAMALQANLRDQSRLTGFSFAGAVVALFATGMIVVTAFGVGARRQLRAYGLVEATGGEPRHVHAIVLWGGIWLGAVGSAIGVLVALVAAYILRPHLNGLANRIVDAVRIPWSGIVGGIALGTLAATIAALAPARQAAQISPVDALAGRAPYPRPPGRLARRGVIGVIVGCVFTVVATTTHEWTLLGIALIVTLTGFLLTIPLLVTFVGRWSARFPAILRLAARQTARYGRRTGAAVAAATLALTAPIALSSLILSNDAQNNSVALIGNDQMMLSSFAPAVVTRTLVTTYVYAQSGVNEVPSTIVDAARSALPNAVFANVRNAVSTVPQGFAGEPGSDEQPAFVTGPPPPPERAAVGAVAIPGQLAVADAALMRASHAEEGIPYMNGDRLIAVGLPTDNGMLHLETTHVGGPTGGIVGVAPGGQPTVAVSQPPSTTTIDVKAITVSGGSGNTQEIPRYFIPQHLLEKYGLHAGVVTQVLLRAPHVLTKAEIMRVKHAVGLIPGGIAQAQQDTVTDSTGVRLGITGGAIGLALIIVAVAVALVGAESRREQAILSAVGAAPNVRRRLVGGNALLMTGLASVLAVPAALIPMALILRARHEPIPIPWSTIGIVALGAPLIAGLIAALASRAPKARAMLQPNW